MYGYGYTFIRNIGDSFDPDAQAFITAAGITDATQQTAINTLVVSLKAAGLWTKMKAIYPFVGGTATTHKFNLKNPLDTNSAFRLSFVGGWTHSATGALPNGTNAFADTFLNPSTSLAQNSTHLSYYSRTNALNTNQLEMGVFPLPSGIGASCFGISFNIAPIGHFRNRVSTSTASTSYIPPSTTGLFISNRTISTQQKVYRNGTLQETANVNSNGISNLNISIAGIRIDTITVSDYSAKQVAFASIGDGLTDTDSSNLYTAVQAFQTTLGRSVGPQTVSDADAQAFVTAANIQDQVQADAVNNLVIGLKADGLWTKMKAIYPFVGGDATSHKWNLKNPLDTNAAFRLVFNGGWTHSANGAQPNGTNAWANTFFVSANNFASKDNAHYSFYSRTNLASDGIEIGVNDAPSNQGLYTRSAGGNALFLLNGGAYPNVATANSLGFYQANRNALNSLSGWKNGIKLSQISSTSVVSTFPSFSIGAYNMNNVTASYYSSKQVAFASLGDGLTDTESSNLYTAVQAFQTALNRQV